jgi:predicted ATPase
MLALHAAWHGRSRQLSRARPALAEGKEGAEDVLASLLGESDLPTTGEQIAWAVRKLLEAAARERPLVVVFDDIHWGEPAFLDLVEHVADLSRDAPILLVCLARPELLERRAGWGGGKLNATAILLEPLDAGETAELIDRLLGGEVLEAGLAERIRIAAEGNPLYVEEMLAMVRESGEHEVTVPPTIKALLAARLDQLDASERAVLERGSVEGQLFHSAAVVALAQHSQSVEPQLVSLVRKELVRPDQPQLPSTDAYRFRHILIRDAAYDALPKATRAELHERFARWLEQAEAPLVERDEIVGYHLEQAYRYRIELGPADAAAEALARQAAELLVAAAHASRLHGDVQAALLLLDRALELDGGERPELLPELAELLVEVGELKRAISLLDEALENAQAGHDGRSEAVAAVWRSVLSGHLGDSSTSVDDTIRLAERAVAVLEREGDDTAVASMLFVLGQHRFFSGQAREAERVLARALDLALGSGDLFRARECVVWSFGAKSFGAASLTEIETALAEIPQILRPALVHTPLHHQHQALTHAYGGRFEEARLHCREGSRMAAELGMRIHGAGTAMF